MVSKRYVASKAISSLLTIFIVLVVNFLLFRVMPGDPGRMLVRDPRAGPDAIKKLEKQKTI